MVPARFLVIFAMTVATAQGDTCSMSNAAYKLKTTLGDAKCSTGSATFISCMTDCCVVKDGTCKKLSDSCSNTKYKDASKDGIAATSATFNDKCCTTKKKCDVACPAGMKDKPDKANTDCAGETCLSTECCVHDPGTCGGYYTTYQKRQLYCQVANKLYDPSKAGLTVKSALSEFQTTCCVAESRCSAACPTGWKDKSDKSAIKCEIYPCHHSECCDKDLTKCEFFKKTCPSTHFKDPTRSGRAVAANGNDFDAQCCTLKATCTAFQTATLGTASGSTRHMVATSSVFAMAGFVLASKYI